MPIHLTRSESGWHTAKQIIKQLTHKCVKPNHIKQIRKRTQKKPYWCPEISK